MKLFYSEFRQKTFNFLYNINKLKELWPKNTRFGPCHKDFGFMDGLDH
jgi:hypothetical protein